MTFSRENVFATFNFRAMKSHSCVASDNDLFFFSSKNISEWWNVNSHNTRFSRGRSRRFQGEIVLPFPYPLTVREISAVDSIYKSAFQTNSRAYNSDQHRGSADTKA